MNNVYSQTQLDWVKEHAKGMTDKELRQAFGDEFGRHVSFAAMRKLRQRLGVKKIGGRPKKSKEKVDNADIIPNEE